MTPPPAPNHQSNPYSGLVKRLQVADGATVANELAHHDLRAVAISRRDLRDDVDGINESVDLIKQTRGGSWPSGLVTDDFNYADLVWHEAEFRDGNSYTYVLRDTGGGYLGCLYLYPVGRRVPLSAETIRFDVDVSWWVTPSAYQSGYYELVYDALQHWMGHELPFVAPLYTNIEIPALER